MVRAPRSAYPVDIDEMKANVDWDAISEFEKVVLTGFPPNFDRLAEEINAEPDLALAFWNDGETLLHTAVAYVHLPTVRLLLDCGASPDAHSDSLGSPLHMATYYGGLELVELLLQHGASVDVLDGYKQTPLHQAVVRNEVGIVERLIRSGVDVNVRGKTGSSALDTAAARCYPEITKLLVAAGGRSRKRRTKEYVSKINA